MTKYNAYQQMCDDFKMLDKCKPFNNGLDYRSVTKVITFPSRKGNAMMQWLIRDKTADLCAEIIQICTMRILSCFVDESGDFGEFSKHSPYYIITMILHDQNNSIEDKVHKLDAELSDLGFNNHVVHTEPLIRREEDYIN